MVLALASASCALHPLSRLPSYADRNRSEYTDSEAFLVAGSDWRLALSVVPVAVYTVRPPFGCRRPYVRAHPALVYHLEADGSFDADAVIHFLQQYRPSRVTFVGRPPAELFQLVASGPVQGLGAGLGPDQVRVVPGGGLHRFWTRVRSVVYAEDDYALAALAATYASLLGAPLVVDGAEPPGRPWPMERRAICVGNVANPGVCSERLGAAELARRYVELARAEALVAMNPRDLTLGIAGPFQPERSARPVATTFSRLSLAAPILAASRHALLVPLALDANDCGPYEGTSHAAFDAAKQRLDASLASLFPRKKPSTLTLVASPQAVPYWSDCGNSNAGAADWRYGAGADGAPLLDVGRIYSLTVSDVSAYVARSVFYERLAKSTYGDSYTSLSIAAPGFAQDQVNAQEIEQHATAAGYEALCFTEAGATAQPDCGKTADVTSGDYQRRQLVTFADHGGATSWAGTLESVDIPWLDLPATFSLACQTNNFWAGGNATFGAVWIRKGGLSYLASIPSTDGYSWELWWAQELTGATRQTLGGISTRLIRRTDYDAEVGRQYILLGDPALRPRSKEVGW